MKRDTGVIAIKVAVLHEIFDGIDDLDNMLDCIYGSICTW